MRWRRECESIKRVERGESKTSSPSAGHGCVVQYYDELAERYDRDRFDNAYGAYVDAQERRILWRWLAPVSQGMVLDLACGTGRLVAELAARGYQVAGFDCNASALEYLRRRLARRPPRPLAERRAPVARPMCRSRKTGPMSGQRSGYPRASGRDRARPSPT